jgi:type IV pilus assembly protein PilW
MLCHELSTMTSVSAGSGRCRQCGLTLVELMVALAVSLVLMAGVIQIYLSSKQTYRIQDGLARVQENGRFAMEHIGRFVRFAGYHVDSTVPADTVFTTANLAIAGTNGTGAASDSITLRFQSDGTMQDCQGADVTNGTMSTNTFSISANSALLCNNGVNPVPQPLAEGVENLQILYGEDLVNNPPLRASRYLPAGSAGLNMGRVVSVRITLVVHTPDDFLVEEAEPYTLNGTTVTPADHRQRHVFSSTIILRNRVP